MTVELSGSRLWTLAPRIERGPNNSEGGDSTVASGIGATGGSGVVDGEVAIVRRGTELATSVVDVPFSGQVTPDGPPPFKIDVHFGACYGRALGRYDRPRRSWPTFTRPSFTMHIRCLLGVRAEAKDISTGETRARQGGQSLFVVRLSREDPTPSGPESTEIATVRDWFAQRDGMRELERPDRKGFDRQFWVSDVPPFSFGFDPDTGTIPGTNSRRPVEGAIGLDISVVLESTAVGNNIIGRTRLVSAFSIAYVTVESIGGGTGGPVGPGLGDALVIEP